MRIYLSDDHKVVREGLKLLLMTVFKNAIYLESNNFARIQSLLYNLLIFPTLLLGEINWPTYITIAIYSQYP